MSTISKVFMGGRDEPGHDDGGGGVNYSLLRNGMAMSFIDTSQLKMVERRPGWRGRFFDSGAMTFGHYEFDKGADIHAHSHPEEEVWHVLEGRLEITIGGETKIAGPGFVGVVPPNVIHSAVALSDGKATVVDTPRREIPGV